MIVSQMFLQKSLSQVTGMVQFLAKYSSVDLSCLSVQKYVPAYILEAIIHNFFTKPRATCLSELSE